MPRLLTIDLRTEPRIVPLNNIDPQFRSLIVLLLQSNRTNVKFDPEQLTKTLDELVRAFEYKTRSLNKNDVRLLENLYQEASRIKANRDDFGIEPNTPTEHFLASEPIWNFLISYNMTKTYPTIVESLGTMKD